MNKKQEKKIIKILFNVFNEGATEGESNLTEHALEIEKIFQKIKLKGELINFLLYLNEKALLNNHDFDYEKEAKKYLKRK